MNPSSVQQSTSVEEQYEKILMENIMPCFLPKMNCLLQIIDWINQSKKKIFVQAYRFNSEKIAKALISSKKRGINVSILIDKEAKTKKNNVIDQLESNNIYVQEDPSANGFMHNKVMIIDDSYVITGSWNWSDTDFYRNNDIVLFIKDECVNKNYEDNFKFNTDNNNQNYLSNVKDIGCNLCPGSLHEPEPKKRKTEKEKADNHYVIQSCFPRFGNENCIKLISDSIDRAKESVLIQACTLTHKEVFKALKRAHNRKIVIKILTDPKAYNDVGEKLTDLGALEGIEVTNDTTCTTTAHSKSVIIDDDVVLVGSLNISYNAQNQNRENLVKITNVHVNKVFKTNFYQKLAQLEQERYPVPSAQETDPLLKFLGMALLGVVVCLGSAYGMGKLVKKK